MIPIIVTIFALLSVMKHQTQDYKEYLKWIKGQPWYKDIFRVAEKYNLCSRVLLSQIYQESRGDPSVTGSAGERGLLQIKEGALSDYNSAHNIKFSFDQMYIAQYNLEVGAWYLANMRNSFNLNIRDSLLAYNSGIGNFRKGNIQSEAYAEQILERV